MNLHKTKISQALLLVLSCLFSASSALAQTDNDALLMNKTQWCSGLVYSHSQWDQYWEGTFKRTNDNIGTVTTQSLALMTAYGITDKLNIMAALPYIWTLESKGTLSGLQGLQDVSLFIKWAPITINIGKGKFSVFTIGGFSTPTHDYEKDFLPSSIGLGSTNLTGRLMAYYKTGMFFVRASGSYIWRSNIKIDRTSYYTTEIHYTNEVQMPDVFTFNGSVGIYRKYLIAEAMVDNMTTLGGFDIRKNDMPFASNRMNSTSISAQVKYTLPFDTHISLVGGVGHVLTGRNMGQATGFNAGVFYALYVSKKEQNKHQPTKTN
ncbi:MAG: transporter [Bacteroidetes bacterium]|nr:transporter [Bacteroidota bacterium]MBS1973657.1 transporter [Bacteroidota bacterium]